MTWVAAAIAGSAVLGAVSSGNAANAQAGAAAASDATQRYMYDKTREDNAPFRDTGVAANNQLAMLLGLDTGGASSQTRDQIRNSLLSQYTTPGTPGNTSGYWLDDGLTGDAHSSDRWVQGAPTAATSSSIDESGLNAAIDQQMATQQTQRSDPSYGSLMRKFSAADMNADPVYQSGLKFGLDQGTQGINRQAAAGGNFLSGATLKALTRFGNDYGSTKANESYNRYNTDQNAQYNKLAGLSGAGQQATNQVSAAGQNAANQISQSQQAAGNARASGYMGQANALSSGVNSWMNYNQNQNMINMMSPQNTDYSAFAARIGGNGR